jgi:hypothetical protein
MLLDGLHQPIYDCSDGLRYYKGVGRKSELIKIEFDHDGKMV